MLPENQVHQLPPASNLPAIPEQYRVSYANGNYNGYDPEPEEASVPLVHYLWILKRHKWKILGFVTAVVLATLIISSRLTPIYESTVTIDVDRRMPSTVIGQEVSPMDARDSDQFLATQIRLIQSDSVLRPVVKRYKLDEPKPGEAPRENLPEHAGDAPVEVEGLKVTRPPNTYLLHISYRSENPRLAADVANAIAESYLQHGFDTKIKASTGMSNFMEKQLEELKAKMERSSGALIAFERELNIINPEEKTSILSGRLVQLNTEYTNAQADRVRKQAAYDSVKDGRLEAALVSTQGQSLAKLLEHLNQAEQNFAAVRSQYGANHPEHRKASIQLAEHQRVFDQTQSAVRERVAVEFHESLRREGMLEKAVAQTKAEYDHLNARSFEYRGLKQEADNDRTLYDELLRKVKEAGINSSFQNSSIRLADAARPSITPVSPNIKLNLLLAFLFSTLLAVGAAIFSDVLDTTIRDPETVSRTLNTEVIGTLPLVKPWKRTLLLVKKHGHSPALALIQSSAPDHASDGFEEAIRAIRNSVLLSDVDRRIRSIMITSASPGEGKSTIASKLAIAHAEQRHKTLIIDGDVRRPTLHRRLGIENASGLTSLNGYETGAWREYVQVVEALPALHALTAGPPSRRSADLIGTQIGEILESASAEYDLVILDSPPLLGFAEPLQMATLVDGVLIIGVAGQTNRKAVASVVQTLQRIRANVLGLVLNEVTQDLNDLYSYHGHYGKYYKYHRSKDDPLEAGNKASALRD
jgi:polysaccharide biosynthesis transport protein